ncbi:MAG: DegT/DnrJ/EryC1/StrS family aminotransferase [Thermoguttaceae bacterium]
MPALSKLAVPFLDLKQQNAAIWPELQAALEGVVRQASFILGPAVERFETALARYLGAGFCVGLNNGTSALHMALRACDVGPGDEVITTPHTWISTSWAISYVGAKPVYVDIDPLTYNLNPALVEAAITPRTKALLPVHLYGQACDLAAFCRIAERHKLALIEDAAQAHGSIFGGRRVGTLGKIGCFSFYPGKNLGAFGEGGAIVTDDEQIARRIRSLRDHAQNGRHNHVELGYNTRMEGVQGAVLAVKLRYLDQWNAARRRHVTCYQQLLSRTAGVQLPAMPACAEAHVWHLYVVLIESDRRRVLQELAQRGIGAGVHYPTLVPLQPAYADLGYRPQDFPVACDVASRCLSLPMFAELTEAQIGRVAEVLQAVLSERHAT